MLWDIYHQWRCLFSIWSRGQQGSAGNLFNSLNQMTIFSNGSKGTLYFLHLVMFLWSGRKDVLGHFEALIALLYCMLWWCFWCWSIQYLWCYPVGTKHCLPKFIIFESKNKLDRIRSLIWNKNIHIHFNILELWLKEYMYYSSPSTSDVPWFLT